jgi:hypothetical protein
MPSSGARAGVAGRAHASAEGEKVEDEGIKVYDRWGRLVIERKEKERGQRQLGCSEGC